MTIDDLTRLAMREAQDFRNKMLVTGQSYSTHEEHYVFARSIVRALRDETRHMTLNRDGLEELFTQILGIAAEEKVAEGIAERADEQRADAPATDPIRDAVAMVRGRVLVVDDIPTLNKLAAAMKPASEAAPAVCVWTGEEYVTYSTSCESEHEVDPHKAPPTHCPSCGKPIAFTEANHG